MCLRLEYVIILNFTLFLKSCHFEIKSILNNCMIIISKIRQDLLVITLVIFI